MTSCTAGTHPEVCISQILWAGLRSMCQDTVPAQPGLVGHGRNEVILQVPSTPNHSVIQRQGEENQTLLPVSLNFHHKRFLLSPPPPADSPNTILAKTRLSLPLWSTQHYIYRGSMNQLLFSSQGVLGSACQLYLAVPEGTAH